MNKYIQGNPCKTIELNTIVAEQKAQSLPQVEDAHLVSVTISVCDLLILLRLI